MPAGTYEMLPKDVRCKKVACIFFTTERATSITTLQLSTYSSQFKVITFQFSLFPSSLQNYGLNCELRVKQTKIISNHLKSRFPTNSF